MLWCRIACCFGLTCTAYTAAAQVLIVVPLDANTLAPIPYAQGVRIGQIVVQDIVLVPQATSSQGCGDVALFAPGTAPGTIVGADVPNHSVPLHITGVPYTVSPVTSTWDSAIQGYRVTSTAVWSGGFANFGGVLWPLPALTGTVTTVVRPACQGDVTWDNAVSGSDLSFVLKWYGKTVPHDHSADITRDGVVDIDDLLAVLNAWGKCP